MQSKRLARVTSCLLTVVMLPLLATTNATHAAALPPGALDTSFHADGKVFEPLGDGGIDVITAQAIQADGKIVAAGYSKTSTVFGFALARFNADGTLDPSFSTDGKVVTPLASGDSKALGVAIQPDGKIVAAGNLSDSSGEFFSTGALRPALRRYNADGTLDTAFGSGGLVTHCGGLQNCVGEIFDITVQPDGKIVAVGTHRDVESEEVFVTRYLASGEFDTSFADGGFTETDVVVGETTSTTVARPNAVVVQSDGKIVLGGQMFTNGGAFQGFLMRLHPSGQPDDDFGASGAVLASNGSNSGVNDIALYPGGRIVAAGYTVAAPLEDRFALWRFRDNGSLDAGFDGDGKVITTFGSPNNDVAQSIAVDALGRIIAGGEASQTDVNDHFAVARYLHNGSLDAAFDGDGKVLTQVGTGAFLQLNDVAIQSDGAILAAGTGFDPNREFALVRYAAEATPDLSPEGLMLFQSDLLGNYDVWAMQADGTIPMNLTSHPGQDGGGDLDPGSNRIAFFSDRNGTEDIWVMNADGFGARPVLSDAEFGTDNEPVWAGVEPESGKRRIVFTSDRDSGFERDLFRINEDGTGLVNLTADSPLWDADADFDPNTNRILFTSNRQDPNFDLYSMSVAGGAATRLTNSSGYDAFGAYSPDGSKIVFMSNRDGGDTEIYVMNSNGTGQTRLTFNSDDDNLPSWSPDGTKIVFNTMRPDHDSQEIYVMNADGSGQTRLTTLESSTEQFARWTQPLTLLASEPSVAANPAQVPLEEIPLQNSSPEMQSAPLNSLPNLSPLNSLPNLSPLNSLPNLSPLNSLPNLSPLNSLPNLSPLNSLPNLSPLNSLPNLSPGSQEVLKGIPLSSLTILTPEGPEGIVAGTSLAGSPVQDISLFDVISTPVARDRLIALTLADLIVGPPLNSIGLGPILLGSTKISDFTGVSFDICAALNGMGYTGCASEFGGTDATLLDLQIGGVRFNDPDHPLPWQSVTMSQFALAADAPLRDALVANIRLSETNFGSITLGSIPAANRADVTNCTSCPESTTLFELSQMTPSRLLATATFENLGSATAGFGLGEIVYALLNDPNASPYEALSLEELGLTQNYLEGAGVQYNLSVKSQVFDTTRPSIRVQLPEGAVVLPGTSHVATAWTTVAPDYGSAFSSSVPTEPVIEAGNVAVWYLGSVFTAANDLNLDFQVSHGLNLGPQSIDLDIESPHANRSSDNQATVKVLENFEPHDSPATALDIEQDILYITHSTVGNQDFFRIPAPSAGSRLQVFVGNRTGDTDLVVYHPTGTQMGLPLRNPVANAASIIPIEDQAPSLNSTGEPVSSEIREDVPLENLPVAGVSANRSAFNETVDVVTWPAAPTDHYLIQVSPYLRDQAVGLYTLRVRVIENPPQTGPARSFPTPNASSTDWSGAGPAPALGIPATTKTLLLANRDRMIDYYGLTRTAAMLNKLDNDLNIDELAAHPKVQGTVIFVESNQAVRDAYEAWDLKPYDVQLSNDVVRKINDYVDSLMASSQANLENIVLFGSEEIIPRPLIPDLTQVGNESTFRPSLAPISGGVNNAHLGTVDNVRSDDPFGDVNPSRYLGRWLYVPDLAVGRILETPEEMKTAIEKFLSSNGTLDRKTAYSAGADFMKDMAEATDKALETATGGAQPQNTDDNWDADVLRSRTTDLAKLPDLVSINAHSDPFRMEPPKPTTGASDDLFTTADIDAAAVKVGGTLLFTMGCHTGDEYPDVLVASAGTPQGQADLNRRARNWSQAISGTGGSFVGMSGYGIGYRDRVALSESLMTSFAQKLNGSMTIGKALMLAKQEYVGSRGAYGVYDEKVSLQAVLAGFPMYQPGPVVAAPPAPPALPLATDPDTGLQTSSITAMPSFTTESTSDGSYHTVGGLAQETHNRPVQPRMEFDVTQPGTTAHGAIITDAVSNDVGGFDPVFVGVSLAGASSSFAEPQFGDVIFPAAPQNLTTQKTMHGDRKKLVLIPGQFQSTGEQDGKIVGRQRLFSRLDTKIFYSNSTDFIEPEINTVEAFKFGGVVTFRVEATDETPTGPGIVKLVTVLFRDTAGWHQVKLINTAGDVWTGGAPFAGSNVEYAVQAVDAAGNVGVSFNKGDLFDAAELPVAPAGISATIAGAQGSNGWYRNATVTLSGAGLTFDFSINGGDYADYTSAFAVSGDGVHVIDYRASNGATGSLVVPIDTTVPVVQIVRPQNGAVYNFGFSVTAAYGCSDAASGVVTCEGPVANGALIDTSTLGSRSFTVNATDASGLGSQATSTYEVDYRFIGFLSPIGRTNDWKAGQTAPMKWKIPTGTGFVRDTATVASIKSYLTPCPAAPISCDVETLPSSEVRYDQKQENFVFNWKTSATWINTTRTFELRLIDGTVHTAQFTFKP